jgi:citron Rho-interacting kinase
MYFFFYFTYKITDEIVFTLKVLLQVVHFYFADRRIVAELRCLRVNISDFEVKKRIGRGHFGEVQVVREKQTGDVYAMKTLHKADTLSQQVVSIMKYNLT